MPTAATEALRSAVDRLTRFCAGSLAAAIALALTLHAHIESFHSARLTIALVVLSLFYVVATPRLVLMRECILYVCFLAYMLIQLMWTADLELALNTLFPAANFVMILVLFGSLVSRYDRKSVLVGTVLGVSLGVLNYTRLSSFPFRYPAEFSYNAIASMYLFGLILTLLLASFSRWQRTLVVGSAVLMVLIVATTSIKTNLGVLLGVIAAGIVHFRYLTRMLRRNALPLTALVAVLAYAVIASDAVVESVQRGVDRVTLGVEVLQARESVPGYSAFEKRAAWQREGLMGWIENPLFGHGVEAFRRHFGITSHATPVDLLYNSGLIGFAFFYGVLASLLLRLYRARNGGWRESRVIIFGGLVCYLFISLSGTMHYNAFLAAFVAIAAALLKHEEPQTRSAVAMTAGS